MRRFGRKIALWRDAAGQVHALEDHCPHRGGAAMSRGVILGDRLVCPLPRRGVRCCDGTGDQAPGSPGCGTMKACAPRWPLPYV